MIIFIRYLLTIGFFLGGLFCIALMIVDGFNWALTGMAMLAGLFCYCVSPSSKMMTRAVLPENLAQILSVN